MAEKTLLEKLEGLQHKFDEISTLITDPSVITDQKRFVKLNKEYHDLERILSAKNEYELALSHLAEAKELLDSETDPEMREMAKMEIDELEQLRPVMEEDIKRCATTSLAISRLRDGRATFLRGTRWRFRP